MATSLNNAEVIDEESDNAKKDSNYSWFVCFSGWLTQVLITGFLWLLVNRPRLLIRIGCILI
jgi:hypothetical protein